jgi:hypothetical protein
MRTCAACIWAKTSAFSADDPAKLDDGALTKAAKAPQTTAFQPDESLKGVLRQRCKCYKQILGRALTAPVV